MRYYKVHIDFTNYIHIDETELSKALIAFQRGIGAIFKEGAIQRISAILPDDVRMMGWNTGYKPTPEEQAEIIRDKTCKSARELMAGVKNSLTSGQNGELEKLSTGK